MNAPAPIAASEEKDMQVKVSRYVRGVFALVLVAGFVAPTLSLSPGAAAASGRREAIVTFTKWVTSPPTKPPASAGAVGQGRYAGKVLSDHTSASGMWTAHARYEFYGAQHSFIADVHVTQTNLTAVIVGVVTTGWLKGARVTGAYTQRNTCPLKTPGNLEGTVCYQGKLQIPLRSTH
jgi:hypothetical protein